MVKRTHAILLLPAAIVGFGVLAGCELDENEVCRSSADCPAPQTCENIDSEGDGTCQDPPDDGTGGGGRCTATSECSDGQVCNGMVDPNVCADPDPAWRYIAVVSTTTVPDDLDNTTPGPDIDAIEMSAGGSSTFASFIEKEIDGNGGDEDEGNNYADGTEVLGNNDSIPGGGDDECNTDAGYYSMGDGTGAVVVSFGSTFVIADGATVKVWELGDEGEEVCDVPTRADSYEVYVGNDGSDPSQLASAAAVIGDFLFVGASAGNGGTRTFTIELPEPEVMAVEDMD